MLNFNNATIECEKENEFIYKFFGTMRLREGAEQMALDVDQVLLRGSSLRNTKWIYGVAIYTGHDSKVMMNSSNNKTATTPKCGEKSSGRKEKVLVGLLNPTQSRSEKSEGVL